LSLAVEARGLYKSFGAAPVVRAVDFAVRRGECVGILGPNGAGKSTTIALVLGLLRPEAGTLAVLGEPVPERAREARRRIGVVPQQDNLDPDFTVAENLEVYARYFGIGRRTLRARLPELLRYAALEHRADARVPALSGGMRRRLTLARALVNDPELLVLDEPTTGLDPQARHLIWQRLRELTRAGRTLLLTTHYMEEAERLCERVLILDHGRVLDAGAPDALVRRHVEAVVVELYGDGADTFAQRLQARAGARVEPVADSLLCYLAAGGADVLDDAPAGVRVIERRSGLEDVFLKLTGRALRDG
jgi:lipooligosaccharide transport system ATP-binding protein